MGAKGAARSPKRKRKSGKQASWPARLAALLAEVQGRVAYSYFCWRCAVCALRKACTCTAICQEEMSSSGAESGYATVLREATHMPWPSERRRSLQRRTHV